ncbi:FlgO family outer membrane protein [Arcobacter sp. LA11]|uniref:FlgO family outer membrane protein n=1 Tax=Arcobacter sp. LA11 TaxID=1898176 RepID=UPI0009330B75|nr:FlgO family outer membrane protein [Arcobacter sp. LA11]
MNKSTLKILKFLLASIFLIFTFSGCSDIVNQIALKSPENHKNFTGSNDFHSLVERLVDKSSAKLKRHIKIDDVVLVSDFVNLDKLKNRSKLGFLLSDHLKDSLLNNDIIVREVELSEYFQYGKRGLNVLTRKQSEINKKEVDSQFAVVGTYSITTQNLIVFIKLIDIRNGNILASSNGRTSIDDEILELEGIKKGRRIHVTSPMVL